MANICMKNDGKSPITVTLLHDTYCRLSGKCVCERRSVRGSKRKKDGSVATTVKDKRMPHVIMLAVGEKSCGLHESARTLPDAMRAIEHGLKIQDDKGNNKDNASAKQGVSTKRLHTGTGKKK